MRIHNPVPDYLGVPVGSLEVDAESARLGGEQEAEVHRVLRVEMCDGLLPLVRAHRSVQSLEGKPKGKFYV
jgi:hypothetical protein